MSQTVLISAFETLKEVQNAKECDPGSVTLFLSGAGATDVK
jgi:hypothetical protein